MEPITFCATDNLVNRSGTRIPAREFPALAEYLKHTYGVSDHWLEYDRVWAKALDAWVETSSIEPLLLGPHTDINKAIIMLEGYQRILVKAQPFDHPSTDQLNTNQIDPISITFFYTEARCPLCDEDVWTCKHSFREIPYIVRHGVRDASEFSLVAAAAVRAAKVLT